VYATIQPAAGGSCNLSSQTILLAVGTPLNGKPMTVTNGGIDANGSPVNLTCSVVSDGAGFDISLSAEALGMGGGILTIVSSGQGTVSPSATSVVVSGNFNSPLVGHYIQQNCTLTFAYDGAPVPTSPPVAGGRIWAHISCPLAVLQGQTGSAGMPIACDAEADFLFENCAGS
jgi:hypothetical protein